MEKNLRRSIAQAESLGYPEFADLTNSFKICVRGELLIVRPRNVSHIISESRSAPRVVAQRVTEQVNLDAIIGYLVAMRPSEVFFSNVSRPLELMHLYNYCKPLGYFIFDHNEDGLTISLSDPDQIAWEPSQNG